MEALLVVEDLSVRPGRPFSMALRLAIDPEWHVYWKNPGDSGLPTTLDWILPPGFTAGPLQWPVPQRFVTDGLVTYGYSGQVMLLTEITPPKQVRAGAVLKLAARAGWLACRVECVPGKASLEVSMPVRQGLPFADARWAEGFSAARLQLPAQGDAAVYSASADSRTITLTGPRPTGPEGAQVLFYPSSAGQVRVSAPQEAKGDGASLRLRMERDTGSGALPRLTGLLVAASRGIEIDLPVTALRSQGLGLVAALLLAFVGGLILNLMPCVLPVISLKVLSFVKQGGEQRKVVVRQGLLFALGVLVSFWIVAGVLVALRSGGHLLGWGFQFQDPAVVMVTAVLFFLVGLNLFGVFEIGTALTRLGVSGRGRRGSGSFISGIFAAAVATPCTAPFMGVAVGYALTHSPGASVGVFTALALGMAAPYVVLSAVPGIVSRLPKPGPWMETLRQVMAFPMLATVIWLASILAALSGSASVVLLLGAILAAGLGAWVWGRWGSLSRAVAVRAAAGLAAILLAVGGTSLAAALVPRSVPGPVPAVPVAAQTRWEPWSQARLDELRQAGTPVFLDFTAKWCLSCRVNEKVALDNPAVLKGLDEAGIVTLRADWTDSSDAIARALAGFGRASVPLYVFYPRGGGEPVILPEILTPAIVLQAIAR